MDVVVTVVGKVVDILFANVGRHISYLSHYKDNFADLKQKIEDLNGARQRIQGEIGVARRKGQDIEPDVEAWISSVDTITLEAQTFLESEEVAAQKIACFHLSSRYKSSKKATSKASSVLALYEKRNNFPTVGRAAPPLGIEASASINVDAYESQRSAMKEITDYLKEEKVHIVGICGIGGVGKTTLVTELGKRVKGKQFDEVVMVAVSRNIDVEKIQQDIATRLGMDKLPEDAGSRRENLWDRILRGNKVLVIMDDVWSRLDLNKLGIPVGKHNNSICKVVLTSRNENECKRMDARTIVQVTPMPEKEAWDLFKFVVMGDDVDTHLDVNQIEGKIFNECGGLPIVIMAVGMSLRNESKNDWELVYENLKSVSPIDNPVLQDVYPVLATSYTYLKDEQAKRCFLLCSLFPEDAQIPVEMLARYGMGLEIFGRGDGSLGDARRGARNAVNTLKHSHLLLPGEDDDHVKMHDVVRDVAITITSQDENNMFVVKAGEGLTMLPDIDSSKRYTGISLMDNNILKLSIGLKCPVLEILLLQNNYSLNPIPHDFFQEMKMLKVLDLGQCQQIQSLPKSLSFCTTIRTLHLDCSWIKDISVLDGLIELEILSLRQTDIVQIPEQIGRLANLRLLDVRQCYHLSRISPGVISSLHKLEDLYIGSSFKRWDIEEEGYQTKNASLTELHSLQRLTNLEIVMPTLETLPHNFEFKSLKRFAVSIGNVDHTDLPTYNHPQCCALNLTDMKISSWGWIEKLMKEVEVLRLDSFENVSNIINDVKDVNFNKLRCLVLSKCDNVSCLVDMVNFDSAQAFCNLEELRLTKLQKLTQIVRGQIDSTDAMFMNLCVIYLLHCPNISTALEFNLLSCLQNLASFTVIDCASVEYIIGGGPMSSYKDGETKFTPNIEDLYLSQLPKLVGICNSHTDPFTSLVNLRVLNIANCGELRRVFSSAMVNDLVCLEGVKIESCDSMEHIFEPMEIDYGASCLQNLRTLSLYGCKNMRYVFSPSIAKRLSRLDSLFVMDCIEIEAIIGVEEIEASPTTTKKIVRFPSLSRIELRELYGLKCFSMEHFNITEYPSLVSLEIYKCDNMETWGWGRQLTPNLTKERMHDRNDIVSLRNGDYGTELFISKWH